MNDQKSLLKLMLLVEPDIQRLTNYILYAARVLAFNAFTVSHKFLCLLPELRNESLANPVEIALLYGQNQLSIKYNGHTRALGSTKTNPSNELIEQLSTELKQASEHAEPELLISRNKKIEALVEKLEITLAQKSEELKETIRKAQTDSLTGIFNRGAYDYRLAESIARCRRQEEPLTLVLLDLDYFKQINDTHGHQYGDEYLIKMAKGMRKFCREHVDIACRIGGDEFALIVFAEIDIADRIANEILKYMDNKVSIGIAQYDGQEKMESLIKRSDDALYRAKELGRGQVACAPPKFSLNHQNTIPIKKGAL